MCVRGPGFCVGSHGADHSRGRSVYLDHGADVSHLENGSQRLRLPLQSPSGATSDRTCGEDGGPDVRHGDFSLMWITDLAGNEAPLLLHRDERSRLRRQAVVHCHRGLVAIGERGRHDHVELKLARGNQAGEGYLRSHAADGDHRHWR